MPAAISKSKASPVPEGYSAVTPYLRIDGAAADALAFYRKAFGAKERMRLVMGDRIGHAEIEIGGAPVMLSDAFPEMGIFGPKALRGTSCVLTIYVANADKAFEKAVAAGATVKRPLQNEFYGDRSGQIEDPFGHIWSIQQRLETVSPREMQKRLDRMMEGAAQQGGGGKAAPAKKKATGKSKA